MEVIVMKTTVKWLEKCLLPLLCFDFFSTIPSESYKSHIKYKLNVTD